MKFIADDFAAIREAMLRLSPKAPAIVHAGNLMPLSTAALDEPKYNTLITYRAFQPMPIEQMNVMTVYTDYSIGRGALPINALQQSSFADVVYQATPTVTQGGKYRPDLFPRLSSPRMTLAQINKWNAFRSHTGMHMQAVLE